MRFIFAVAMAFVSAANVVNSVPLSASTGSESLGNQLLDDLPRSASPPSTNSPADTHRDSNVIAPIDPNLTPPDPEIRFHPLRFDDVGRDENAQPSGPMHLVRAGQGMVQAEAFLKKQATIGQVGETQQQVVAQLDQLVAELSKQCSGNCNNPSNKPPSPSQRSQAKPDKSSSKAGRGNAPARDSNAQLNGNATKPADASERDLEDVVKHLWGQLPEREREQMMQTFSDEFLPKYQSEIEQYYQRLSEENDAAPSQ